MSVICLMIFIEVVAKPHSLSVSSLNLASHGGLTPEIFKGTVPVYSPTGGFCHFPGILVVYVRGKIWPKLTPARFDGMDSATFDFPVKENAEIISSGFEIGLTVSFPAEFSQKSGDADLEKTGDVFLFPVQHENTAFTIAALPAHAAFKCFLHESNPFFLIISSMFQSTKSRNLVSIPFFL